MLPPYLPQVLSDYRPILTGLEQLQSVEEWDLRFRFLSQNDLYFLLRYTLQRKDAEDQWIMNRCREVQANPDGYLDLWAREHYKSTIITFALTIQDVLNDPELTVGIFSHTRPIAKGFLRQIMREFATNEQLKAAFPEIFWADPKKESPKWSEDDGIVLKRKGNPKESTIEAHGLVDGQPTSKHFRLMVYDDVVTRESVTSPDMIAKVTEAWELSRNLTAVGGKTRYIGTRYNYNDTYREILRRQAAVERRHPATIDGTVEGRPVLIKASRLADKRREMGPFTFASQMLLDPRADETQGFKEEWLNYYEGYNSGLGMNKYILVDPANSKKQSSDYTSIWTIGLGGDQNYYVLDGIRDRLSLTQRADALFAFHRKWKPKLVGYEQYGMQADIEHFKDRMGRENYRFAIVPLAGKISKVERIRRLIPSMENGRWYLPQTLLKTNYEKKTVDLVHAFVEEEYKPFPVGIHDDMFDAMSRILDEDLGIIWPRGELKEDRYTRSKRKGGSGSFMSA
jgi:predicted phage terminase large subunit-like protein